jgi:peptidoglycan/xylan/chitin deacetylase (PgdA/CDA1 family)
MISAPATGNGQERPGSTRATFGALVISLDFEIHWGVRDRYSTTGGYRSNLLGVRTVIPRLLALFAEFEVSATWAIVGYLLARSRDELQRFSPHAKPHYVDSRLFPYDEQIGESEADDPFHYAPSLVDLIRRTPRQEVGTHTFSHYYCLEPGHDRVSFRADIESAIAISRAQGFSPKSIVFPRNQWNQAYDDVLCDAGITCYRGPQRGWMYRTPESGVAALASRGARLLDSHVSVTGPLTVLWHEVMQPSGLADVRASFFLRPVRSSLSDALRFRRVAQAVHDAAESHRLVHLWWHPHNFGAEPDANMAFLRRVLEVFSHCRARHGMRSMSMIDVASAARDARS